MKKKQFIRLIVSLFFVVFFSTWLLLAVNAVDPIRSTPSFSANFNSRLTSSWGLFYNNGPFYNGCTHLYNTSIVRNMDCAHFNNEVYFDVPNSNYYAYRRLSSPLKTYAQLYGNDGLTVEFSLKLESLPIFYNDFSYFDDKLGQTGFVVNIRCGEKDSELYLCIFSDPAHTGKLCVSSYSGSRYAINANTPGVIGNIDYSSIGFTKFSLVFQKASGNNTSPYQGILRLYVNGDYCGSFSNLTYRGAGSMQESFVYFSLVSRPLFCSFNGAYLDASSSIWLDYVNIHNKPMPQPTFMANVPLYGQETRDTCGAASIRMVLANLGIHEDEASIYALMGSPGTNNTENALNLILDDYGKPTYTRSDTWISQSDFISRMQNNLVFDYPVIVFLKIKNNDSTGYFGYSLDTNTGGHVVVVSGMKTENGTTYFEIHDPFSYVADVNNPNEYRGQIVWIPADVLHRAFEQHSNTTISYIC